MRLLAQVGIAVGHQVRIIRNSEEYGLYTVTEARPETLHTVIRMGLAGRQRLRSDGEFEGFLDPQVPHPTMAEDIAEVSSEFVERLDDDGVQSALITIAPRGGDIERHTDQQAERVASLLAAEAVTSWRCKGWKCGGGALARWHITSTDIHESSFPLLRSVISRGFTYAIAFHGFDRPDILIGGTAPVPVKQEVQEAIRLATAGSGIEVRVAVLGDGFGGDDPGNIVNRLTAGGAGGIQVEQSLRARDDYWCAIADAVVDVYRGKL